MVTVYRGRPRNEHIDEAALTATEAILAERGYESLRMKDVAERAGIGLGALYRRWPGKQDLVVAALRTGVHEPRAPDAGDPADQLVAALMRVGDAFDHGLGMLLAACLRDPGSEIAAVAREAKFAPMVTAVGQYLQRCGGDHGDIATRSEMGLAFLLWRTATTGNAPTESEIRNDLLPLMGVAPPPERAPSN